MKKTLTIKNLSIGVGGREVVKDFSLTVRPGEIHTLMGPNGSGKSSIAYTVSGHPSYRVSKGSIHLDNTDLLLLKPEERAKHGLFLSFQEPPEIGGVSMRTFLNTISAGSKNIDSEVLETLTTLGLEPTFLSRFLNEGFSGGEKKKSEVLQLVFRDPDVAILDEIDTGLDIDAIKFVTRLLKEVRDKETGLLLISHSPRLFEDFKPDRVHILINGICTVSAGPEILSILEEKGYATFENNLVEQHEREITIIKN